MTQAATAVAAAAAAEERARRTRRRRGSRVLASATSATSTFPRCTRFCAHAPWRARPGSRFRARTALPPRATSRSRCPRVMHSSSAATPPCLSCHPMGATSRPSFPEKITHAFPRLRFRSWPHPPQTGASPRASHASNRCLPPAAPFLAAGAAVAAASCSCVRDHFQFPCHCRRPHPRHRRRLRRSAGADPVSPRTSALQAGLRASERSPTTAAAAVTAPTRRKPRGVIVPIAAVARAAKMKVKAKAEVKAKVVAKTAAAAAATVVGMCSSACTCHVLAGAKQVTPAASRTPLLRPRPRRPSSSS
mmetsp:Transcript_33766/g.85037  ORF Transcript_33766/g.85037 Transcript_33766/m.85037 type:complete len:305 (+) Transcript_33766:1583-2497(+)